MSNTSTSPTVHSFRVNFTQFSANNQLDLDPSSTIIVRQDRTVQIIPDNYQSTKRIITPQKTPNTTNTRTAYTGSIMRTREDQGTVKAFNAFMNFWAGGSLDVDFDTKQVKIHVSGSGVPTIENIIGVIV
ncbi:predicted protein [Naegleria gruberi]|uniref:Predicted protein n=1 Tax=Naegleria gruberi TaxID=5762 RepID=D2V047_NAEGR|nr:uncharacterized protein NAEGRDRAFT_62167 [Naegleria gruberi]EFC49652.1 predicted protein [Naegleria gruberi]|eukprot:XP_002682396.1 predicted protein [Naegleria gruberi strain NEG-M]